MERRRPAAWSALAQLMALSVVKAAVGSGNVPRVAVGLAVVLVAIAIPLQALASPFADSGLNIGRRTPSRSASNTNAQRWRR